MCLAVKLHLFHCRKSKVHEMTSSQCSTLFLHPPVERTAQQGWMGVFYTNVILARDLALLFSKDRLRSSGWQKWRAASPSTTVLIVDDAAREWRVPAVCEVRLSPIKRSVQCLIVGFVA